ncbi:MAG: hypothetical protein ACP5UM_04945 [Anaerolineae bacterium]
MSDEERQEVGQEEGREPDLERELAELGRRLTQAAQTAWETEEARRLRQEVKAGLEKLLAELEQGVERAREHPTTQKVQEEVEEMLESARRGKIAQEVKEGITQALRSLNAELDRLIQRLEETQKPEEGEKEG